MVENISLTTVEEFISTISNLQPNSRESYKNTIKCFFEFYSNNFVKLKWLDIYEYLDKTDSISCEAQRSNNKWPNIPDEYFSQLINLCEQVMKDDKAPIDDRGIAAEVLILANTGLRQGELRDAPTNTLHSISILNGEKTAFYLEYFTSKNVKGDGNQKLVHSFMTAQAVDAYNILLEVYDKNRQYKKVDYLFVPTRAITLPVTENALDRMLTNFLLKYSSQIDCVNVHEKYPELKAVALRNIIKRTLISKDIYSKFSENDYISIPRPHQFRVYICNRLFRHNVPRLFISQHMNHLSTEMDDYYYRPKKDPQKEKENAESIMKMIVTKEIEIIGDNKTALMARIDEYLEKNKVKVAINLEEIVKEMVKLMPVRAKAGGFCIKSGPIRDCSKNEITDEIYCAYDICPNSFHAYCCIDITFDKCTELLKTIELNKKNGFHKAAEKETNKLRWIVEKQLLPEVNDLNKKVSEKGEEHIKYTFPQLSWFVDNVEFILEEVKRWLN